jgi:hypothetical protein
MCRLLTETIASGRGFRPAGDVESVTGATPTSFADFVPALRPILARAVVTSRHIDPLSHQTPTERVQW